MKKETFEQTKQKYLNKINSMENEIKKLNLQIELLEKNKYELLKTPYNEIYWVLKENGNVISKISSNNQTYNQFETLEKAEFFSNPIKIFYALANFSANNDKESCNFIWGCKGLDQKKWYIELNPPNLILNFSTSIKKLNCIYFSSKELAESAIEMLKQEKLI